MQRTEKNYHFFSSYTAALTEFEKVKNNETRRTNKKSNEKEYHFFIDSFRWKSIEINVKMIVINVEYM